MTITFNSGSISTDATEKTIWDITADEHFAGWVFTNAMQSGDTVVIRVYVKDQQGAAMRQYSSSTISDAQTEPAYHIPFVPTKEHKVTIQRTAGTDRSYNWQRAEVL